MNNFLNIDGRPGENSQAADADKPNDLLIGGDGADVLQGADYDTQLESRTEDAGLEVIVAAATTDTALPIRSGTGAEVDLALQSASTDAFDYFPEHAEASPALMLHCANGEHSPEDQQTHFTFQMDIGEVPLIF